VPPLPRARDDDHVVGVDGPLDGELRAALEGGVLDLVVELGLAAGGAEAVDVPDDVVGEASEIASWSLRRNPSM
jgi:hypothetical protein